MPATIIDSLVVMLGIDAKDLESKTPGITSALNKIEKQGEKTEQSHQKITKAQKEQARSTEDLSRVVKSFLAVIGGTMAIKAFVNDFINANAQLDRLSKNLGISVETISAWSNATQKLGGSAEGLQGTLDMLSRSQTQLMLTGQSSLIPYMSALGISLADVNGKARPVTDILLELSDRFSRMDRTTANNMGRMMGLDQGTLNLLLQGRKELELEIERQKEQNVVTKAQAAEATKLQRSIVGVKQTFASFGRSLLMDAAPSIEKLLGLFERFGNWVVENKEFVEDFLKVLAVGLGAIALAALPIDPVVVAIGALGAAIALLWQDYQVWKRGGDSFINWQVWIDDIKKVKPWIDGLNGALQNLKDNLTFLKDLIPDSWARGLQSLVHKIVPLAPSTASRGLPSRFLGTMGAGASSTNPLAHAIAKQEGFFASGATANRAQRNHNPGNIEYGEFAKKHGATGSDGRFAIFPNDQAGMDALTALLSSPAYSGLSTEDAIKKYAPPSENNTAAYIASVKQSLAGIPGASSMAASAPQAPASGQTNIDRSVEVNIQSMPIHTQATDAAGIASDMGQSLDYLFASQANYGLN